MASLVIEQKDFSQPIIRRKILSAHSAGTMRAEVDFGQYGTIVTDEPVEHGGSGDGPSPLQVLLGALCGCETVTFNRTAADLGFEYDGIDFDAAFTIDIRGRQGMRDVVPHFQTVKVEATVRTNESESRLREVVEETEKRCPIYNLLSDAGVRIEAVWIRKPAL